MSGKYDGFIGIVTGVFAPYLGVLSACGILKGFLALCTAVGILDGAGGTYNILYALADTAFYFLPVMLGYTAAKRFGLPELEGLLIGSALLYPSLLSATEVDISSLFGISVSMPASGDYTGSVIPIICAVAFGAWFEKRYKKFIPATIRIFALPLITCFITFVLIILVVGPVVLLLSGILGEIFTEIYEFSEVLMGAVVGFFWQILVMLGLHWAIIPIMQMNMEAMGFDSSMAGMFGATFAQTGIVIGIMLKTKDEKRKALCPPAIISALAGVAEPAIYGITLPKKAPFIRSCIVAAIGGVVTALGGMYVAIGVSALCLVLGIISELIFYKDTPKQEVRPENKAETVDDTGKKGCIYAPMNGESMALELVEDETFCTGALGSGLAIIPSEGVLYAPADGEITELSPTGHVIGIRTREGIELLIHVGMDTMKLKGEGFMPRAVQGDKVRKGDLILEFDINKIKRAGYSVTTPIIVANTEDYEEVIVEVVGKVAQGDKLMTII